jgi:adenylosuccinate lyase
MAHDVFESPLNSRYCSDEMKFVWSPQFKHQTWRQMWVWVAEAQLELDLRGPDGQPVVQQSQIDEMKQFITDINWAEAQAEEKKRRHDIMAHVHAFGLQAQSAKGIVHLGCTSADIGDNTDLIQSREALKLVRARLCRVIDALSKFALEYRELPLLGATHLQPAQPTTVGKRACLWLQDLLLDLEEMDRLVHTLPFRGIKGTTGTQASFFELFQGDHTKVKSLDQLVSQKAGFAKTLTIAGQTYTRKLDSILNKALSNLAESLSKFSTDLRLLQGNKEIEEPFEKDQIGSSAMAYKRNPMRSERIGSLARFVMAQVNATAFTAATQWFERTLDDSANKRLAIPEAFLAVDAMLILAENICKGMVVYPKVIERRLMAELPFMATENIIMECVKKGGDRQVLHEAIRVLSQQAGRVVKEEGKDNDLLERILDFDKALPMAERAQFGLEEFTGFGLTRDDLGRILDLHKFVGRAPEQVREFVTQEVQPMLAQIPGWEGLGAGEVKV